MSDPTRSPEVRPLRFQDIGFVSLFFLLLAASGLLIVLGNLTGLAAGTRHVFPVVDNLPGLMSTTLVLFALACMPIFLRGFLRSR